MQFLILAKIIEVAARRFVVLLVVILHKPSCYLENLWPVFAELVIGLIPFGIFQRHATSLGV